MHGGGQTASHVYVIEITNFGVIVPIWVRLREECALRHITLETCVVWRRSACARGAGSVGCDGGYLNI